jgi:mannose-6-phosphate isomerase-like protein (cupin superfamily)
MMKEKTLPDLPDGKSPAGADIRLLMNSATGDMIHSTVPVGQTNRAVVHATVNEFWYILEGHGEIWRKEGRQERVTTLVPGVAIDIPVGTAFQYRNVGPEPLRFICVTMPRWRGDQESTYVEGTWQPSI